MTRTRRTRTAGIALARNVAASVTVAVAVLGVGLIPPSPAAVTDPSGVVAASGDGVHRAVSPVRAVAFAPSDDRGCWASPIHPNGTQSRCLRLGIAQRFRAVVKCDGFFKDYYRYGRWITTRTEASIIYCDNSRTRAKAHTYQLETWT